MAINRNTCILGNIKGKLGPVVFVKWKVLNVVRTLPTTPKKPKISDKQVKERTLFTIVQEFVSNIPSTIINLGYQLPRNAKKTAYNEALAYHKLNAVGGEAPDFFIDFNKVKLTNPINLTAGAWNVKVDISTPREILVSWELNLFPQKNTQPDDMAHVVFYEQIDSRFIEMKQVRRDDLYFSFRNVRKSAVKRNMFCWIFFSSADNKLVSRSEYLGNFEC